MEALMIKAPCEMEKEQQIYVNIRDVRRGAETVNVRRMSTSGCGYHGRDGTNSTERDDVATNEQWASVEEPQVVEQTTVESKNWCTQDARRPPGGLLERPLRRRTQRRANILRSGARIQHWQGDVADDRNVTIIELGDDGTADDLSDGKTEHMWKKDRSSIRPRGREEKRPHVPKNIGHQEQVLDDAKRFASEVGLR